MPRQAPAPVAPNAARTAWTYFVIAGLTAIVVVLAFMTYRSKSPRTLQTLPILPAPLPVPLAASPAASVPAPEKPKKPTVPAGVAVSAAPPAGSSTPLPSSGPAQPIRELALNYVPDSTVKLEQLIGDQDKQRHEPTASQTFTRFGVEGTEIGYSFEHQGHAYFLFGPTVGRVPQEPDTIAMTDTANPEGGVRLDFLTNGGSYIAVQPSDINMSLMDVPASGISLDGQLYVVASVGGTRGRATSRSVLTKFSAPSTFQTIHTISQLPDGKFIRMSIHAQPGPIPGLPAGGPYILTWGTGKYRESDAYLSVVPAGQFEAGKGTRYFAGLNAVNVPTWSDNESDATPIVKDGTLGDLSVTWCKELNLWLMTYDRRTQPMGIAFSYSKTPWGPWSEPQIIFNAVRDNGLGKFIHNPLRKIDDGLAGPVMGPKRQANAEEVRGGAYAPYVVERWTRVQGSTLNLYYVLSTGNPYVVVLMESRLRIE